MDSDFPRSVQGATNQFAEIGIRNIVVKFVQVVTRVFGRAAHTVSLATADLEIGRFGTHRHVRITISEASAGCNVWAVGAGADRTSHHSIGAFPSNEGVIAITGETVIETHSKGITQGVATVVGRTIVKGISKMSATATLTCATRFIAIARVGISYSVPQERLLSGGADNGDRDVADV